MLTVGLLNVYPLESTNQHLEYVQVFTGGLIIFDVINEAYYIDVPGTWATVTNGLVIVYIWYSHVLLQSVNKVFNLKVKSLKIDEV